MKRFLFLIPIIFISCSASRKQFKNVPLCIREKIQSFQKEPRQNPPRSIIEYVYNGNKVYYISAPCCDQFSDLFDDSCNLLGHPDGGFTGKGDKSLPDFNTVKTEEKIIWKDNR